MAIAADFGYGHRFQDTFQGKAHHISFGCFKARPRYQLYIYLFFLKKFFARARQSSLETRVRDVRSQDQISLGQHAACSRARVHRASEPGEIVASGG